MIRKILIPNRGEIAYRIIKTAHKMGIETVVMLSKQEKETLPATCSDEVYFFEKEDLSDSFLNIDLIIRVAKQFNVDAIHPGYGFLSENAQFALTCVENNIIYIGPTPENIQLMGDKEEARAVAKKCNVPLTESLEGSAEEILEKASTLSYPVLIKAALGGGGKGMVKCKNAFELQHELPLVARQAQNYFGNGKVYVEQYLDSPRHIEIQVFGDHLGNLVHLYERECSIQRRYQKIIEEAPAPQLTEKKRIELCNDALKLCRKIKYSNAGTVEFLIDKSGKHFFLEMNTRIQVEHPVTEAITNIDMVEWQIRIAMGEALPQKQQDILKQGHAIEARLYAEDPSANFKPSPGTITHWELSKTKHLRIDSYMDHINEVLPHYDPMLAKLIVHEKNRELAIQSLKKTLNESFVLGIQTNLNYLLAICKNQAFINGETNTNYCQNYHAELTQSLPEKISIILGVAITKQLLANRQKTPFRSLRVKNYSIDNETYTIPYTICQNEIEFYINDQKNSAKLLKHKNNCLNLLINNKNIYAAALSAHENIIIKTETGEYCVKDLSILPDYEPIDDQNNSSNTNHLKVPLPGKVTQLNTSEGQWVKKGDLLLTIEAMKMENRLLAWKDGIIEKIFIRQNSQVKANEILLSFKSNENQNFQS